jgi:hypothetical protein
MNRHGRILYRTKYTPNRFIDHGTHIGIELYREKTGEVIGEALVDLDQLSRVRKYKWHVASRHCSYAETFLRKGRSILLHQFVIGRKPGLDIDHINGDGLDCRRRNLRHVSHYANVLNRHRRLNKSGHMGISWRADRNCWVASIIRNGKDTHRHFKRKEEAIAQREKWEQEVLAAA